MSTLTRIVCDFAEFYGVTDCLNRICDALNDDRTFDSVLAVLGVAATVVIGVTL